MPGESDLHVRIERVKTHLDAIRRDRPGDLDAALKLALQAARMEERSDGPAGRAIARSDGHGSADPA